MLLKHTFLLPNKQFSVSLPSSVERFRTVLVGSSIHTHTHTSHTLFFLTAPLTLENLAETLGRSSMLARSGA